MKGDNTKLQVHIPTPIYERVKGLAQKREGSIARHGQMAKIVTIALRQFLDRDDAEAIILKEPDLNDLI
jgi:hypothetical protein